MQHPGNFRRRATSASIGSVLGLLLAVTLITGQALAARSGAPALEIKEESEAEAYLLQKINEERLAAGREALAVDPLLVHLAREKARDMAERGYFDHVSPVLGTVFDMLRREGVAYKWAGENIARATSLVAAHQALMESPDHRANILSAGYTHVGVGVYRSGGKWHIAQIFMRPRA